MVEVQKMQEQFFAVHPVHKKGEEPLSSSPFYRVFYRCKINITPKLLGD